VALIALSHLAPRLKKEYNYTSTPSLGIRGMLQAKFSKKKIKKYK